MDNVTAGVERVKQSTDSTQGFALIAEATEVRYAVLTDPCSLEQVGEEFSRKPYALAVQKGSPLKDQLSERQVNYLTFLCNNYSGVSILKLLNQRELELLKERWWTHNPQRKVRISSPDLVSL